MAQSSVAIREEGSMTDFAARVSIKFSDGHEQAASMLAVDLGEETFVVCDPMYTVKEGLPDIEEVIYYLIDNVEPVRVGLPDGVVLRAMVEMTGVNFFTPVAEVNLLVTPLSPALPWPWGPRRGHGWYGADD